MLGQRERWSHPEEKIPAEEQAFRESAGGNSDQVICWEQQTAWSAKGCKWALALLSTSAAPDKMRAAQLKGETEAFPPQDQWQDTDILHLGDIQMYKWKSNPSP